MLYNGSCIFARQKLPNYKLYLHPIGKSSAARQGLERYTFAAAADVFCWRVAADEGSTRTAYKNTAAAKRVKRKARLAAQRGHEWAMQARRAAQNSAWMLEGRSKRVEGRN